MYDRPPNGSNKQGRRAFLGTLAASAAAGATGLSFAIDPAKAWAETRALGAPDPEHWLDGLKGQHKHLVDGYAPNDGFPLGFVFSFYAVQPPPAQVGTVLVMRHIFMPFALKDAMWAKYKIGDAFKIVDPETKKPAVKNPFYKPKPGVMFVDDAAIDKLQAKGCIMGACNVALTILSGELAEGAKMTKDAAKAEWTANILPGITIIPSGTWGVNRAQEKGCTYCSGGG